MKSKHILTLVDLIFMVVMVTSAQNRIDDRVCQVEYCSVCTESSAQCSTPYLYESLFSSLHRSITFLSLRVNPPGLKYEKLGKNMLQPFDQLERLQLMGDFSVIELGAFDHLTNLRSLSISDSALTSLPDGLLNNCSLLQKLKIHNTQLDVLPFDALVNVQHGFNLKVAYDRPTTINISCGDSDQAELPTKHAGLYRNITTLSLVGLEFQFINCTEPRLSKHFFEPFKSLQVLNVSHSNFFIDNPTLLKPLPQLQKIIADSVEPFASCAADAAPFFSALPKSLRSAIFTHWENLQSINISCVLDKDTLEPLSSLPYLEELSFQFSDYGFGVELDGTIFPNMSMLKKLNLAFSSITRIYHFPNHKLPQLEVLRLDGNPLGSRRSALGSQLGNSTVSKLYLAHSGIWSTRLLDYDLAPIIDGFPEIRFVNLSENYLERPPVYRNDFPNHSRSLSTLIINDNSIADTATLSNSLQISLCVQFPHLTKISLARNFLRQLEGMCEQIRDLNLEDNFLTNNLVTLEVLNQLINLEALDLSENKFTASSGMLDNLTNLKEIDLSGNNIYELPDDFFKKNFQLTHIRLASNYISTISVKAFQHLEKLEYLNLKGNQISIFPELLTQFIDKSVSIDLVLLGDNPFDCRCQHSYFQNWVSKTKKIPSNTLKNLRCSTPVLKIGKYVLTYVDDYFECKVKEPLTIVGSVFAAIIITALLALPCYKYSWYIRHIRVVSRAVRENLKSIKQEHICEYDAYVSYNQEDQEDSMWVVNHLIPTVEAEPIDPSKPQLKLYVEGRDAGAGTQRFTEKAKVLKQCNKILIVVSNSYLKSAYCLGEADLSGCEMYGTEFYQPNRVLVLVREELTEEIIKPPMTALLVGNVIRVNHSNERRLRAAWKNISRFVSSRYIYHKKKRQHKKSRRQTTRKENCASSHVAMDEV